ncbi:Ig-like domain-containing protein [Pyxidicoccus xibeiensis]|uniref:Ig-like domain-containing protein n=1 Tax=Pyxidicoccus xibeiensis TaxID=2906759 RepID=UPI0020A72C71|nr:Ig-like domain-containing protein [Pyxidicoccus xibeiensis]MCP3145060.1 Ig-like domain-containing protein [Pyxidicoccus xibeiensis]
MRASASSLFAPPFRISCLLALTLAVACTRDAPAPAASEPPAPAVPEAQTPRPESAPFDVGAVIRQVHFAFRPDKEAWSGGHATYTVRSGAQGLTLTPYHHLRDAKAAPRPGVSGKAGAPASTLEGAPLTLGTPRLTRGARRLGADAAKGQVEQDGHLTLARGDVTEHLRNGDDGVEQSWAFERAPAGAGDLLVEIPVEGLTYRGVTGTGLHFSDAKTGLGFRYGHATWVDGRGQRTSLSASFSEGRIQLRVPAGVLDGSAYPAVLDPFITPEFGMDSPVLGPQLDDQMAPVVSALGSTWLVAWLDFHGSGPAHLTGSRVSSSGQVLDPIGITLSPGARSQGGAAIAASSSEWLVVWEDTTSSASDIYGMRVSVSGQVLDPAGIAIAATTGSQISPAVTSSGSGWYVVWSEANSSSSISLINGVRLSSTGQPVGSPVRLSTATGWALSPDVAFNGTNYFVVWQDYTSARGFDIRGARVSSTGTLVDATPRTLVAMGGDQRRAAVANNSTSWFVAWEDLRADSNGGDIFGTVVWSDGTVATPNGQRITVGSGAQTYPDVAALGSGWFLVWEDPENGFPDIQGVSLDSSGSPSRYVTVSADGRAEYLPSVSSAGGDVLVVWYEAHGNYDVHAARVTTSNVVRDTPGLLLSTAYNEQFSPSVARNGTDYLVVWRDNRAGQSDIYGARVTSQGTVLDPSGMALCTVSGEQDNPVVASNGTDWMVAWDDNRFDATYEDLYGVRLSRTGVFLSGWSITQLSSAMRRPALASDGTDWYVVWEDGRSSLSLASWDIFGARISPAGVVTPSAGTNLTTGNNFRQGSPSIAFNGTDYLVAWTDYRSGEDIYGTRVSRTGTVMPEGGFMLSGAPGDQLAPVVASAGSEWFVVWQDARTGLDIYGTRVSSSGVVMDAPGLAIATTAIAQRNPTVASDGTNYFVAWEEQTTSTNRDIHGARLSGAGSVLDAPFAIAAAAENETLPSAATHAPSEFMLVYQRTSSATATPNERIRARRVTFNRAPVVSARTLTTAEDTPAAITLTGTDADSNSITFTLVTPPGQGTLSGTPPDVTYTPSANYHGPDSFTYRATDAWGESSAPATVSVTVTPVNDPPTGVPVPVQLNEDSAVDLPPLQGTDPDNDALTFAVQELPTHGTLTGTPASLRYVPDADHHGTDSFTFIVTDASGAASAPVRVPITIHPMNDVPVAFPQSAQLDQDSGVDLVLQGMDVDGDALTFHIDRVPAHGTLSGTAPSVRYTPATGYSGPDDFVFRVRDGQASSASVTVSLTVRYVNGAPTAIARWVTTPEDTALALTLSGVDPDGGALTYAVATWPTHGSLSGTPPSLTYTPGPDFHGSDRFTFVVRDSSGLSSAPATVTVTVAPVNDAPVGLAQSGELDEDTRLDLVLRASDVDGDILTFNTTVPPSRGSLTGTPPNVRYVPFPNLHGTDSFSFQVSDGRALSAPVTVSLTIRPVNDAPRANPISILMNEDAPVNITLSGTDPEGEALTFAVATPPAHGTLSGTPPNVTYTPTADFNGDDLITYTATDTAGATSPPGSIRITVRPNNDHPVAHSQAVELDEDTPAAITLTGSDVEGSALTFVIGRPPAHGSLSGTPPDVTYTPASGFHGTDSFTFTVRDDQVFPSASATVSLSVRPVNDAPVALGQSRVADEDTQLTLTLTGRDVDGDELTFNLASAPTHGALSGSAPDVTYTPASDFHGEDSFTFTVTDAHGATSEAATVRLTVRPVNDSPEAQAQAVETDEDTARAITLAGSDVEGGSLTFAIAAPPAHGTLSGTPPDVTYTPTADFHGTDGFTFTATDSSGATSAPATVMVTVQPMNDTPVATAQSRETDEDTAVSLRLAGTDVDGEDLTFALGSTPTRGTLSGTPPDVTYTPDANFHGTDSFTFTVTDATGVTSAPATVTLTVRPTNDAPVAVAQSQETNEDLPVLLALTGTDLDDQYLTFAVATQPAHGTVTGTPPDVTYTPAADFHGTDRFTFTVTDASGATSAPATVSLTVRPVNDAPVALAQSGSLDEDTGLDLVLRGSDVDGDALTFIIAVPPSRGSLTGTPPDVRYTPPPNFHGTDSFSFQVSDGRERSALVSVSLTMRPVNDAPVALPFGIGLDEDASMNFTLSGTDPEGEALTYAVATPPAHGMLIGSAPDLTYQPAADFHGTDSFTFTATDATGATSPAATVHITVNPINDAPVAQAVSAELDEDTPAIITLAGSDVEGNALTFIIGQPPAHGMLSGTPPAVRYLPARDFHGADSFTFTVRDSRGATSTPATVSLTVRPRNDAPVALAQTAETNEDTSVSLSLTGTDVDGQGLTFALGSMPERGTLTGTPPDVTYTPAANFHGTDRFTFTVTDASGATSAPATVTVTVLSVNDAPVALAQSRETEEDRQLALTLSGTDTDGDDLTFTLGSPPTHGVLTGSAPDLTYTPAADFHGEDSFTFTVTDTRGATSASATVRLTVRPVNDTPVAHAQAVETDEDTTRAITLTGADVEGGSLTFAFATPPARGTLSGTPPHVTYTPAADFHGTDSFTFTAMDPSGATSAPETVTVTVRPSNDAPVATAQSRETDEDTAVSLTLSGTDVDGQDLTFTVATQPEHGALTGTPPDVTYTPAADFHGTDSFTFTVSDGVATSTATVSLTVRPVNDVPLALDQTLQVEPEPTALTLAGTDADGDSLTFAIHTQPEQGTLTGTPPEVTFTPSEGFRGTATFTFTVSDGMATSAPATVTLRVGNSAPVVAFTTQTQRPDEGEALRFQTTAADANGDALTFAWDFGDGATSEETSPTHAYANEGTYETVLTVTDGIDTVRQSVVLEVQNAAPVLVPVEAPARAEEGQALTFHAQASDSGERDALAFTWDFGDGSAPASGPETTHTYADSGTYTVKVTVTDDVGAFTQSVREVQVANLPPVPEPVPAQTARGGDALSLQLAATDVAGERDPLTWSLVEGPGAVTPEGLYTWQTEASTDGHFPVRVRVTDDDGGSADLVLDVTVTARQQRPVILPPDSGCGCASSQGGAASSATLLFLVAVLVSRRKRA